MSDSHPRDQDVLTEYPSKDHVFASSKELLSAFREVGESTTLSFSARVELRTAYVKQLNRFRPPSLCKSAPSLAAAHVLTLRLSVTGEMLIAELGPFMDACQDKENIGKLLLAHMILMACLQRGCYRSIHVCPCTFFSCPCMTRLMPI